MSNEEVTAELEFLHSQIFLLQAELWALKEQLAEKRRQEAALSSQMLSSSFAATANVFPSSFGGR